MLGRLCCLNFVLGRGLRGLESSPPRAASLICCFSETLLSATWTRSTGESPSPAHHVGSLRRWLEVSRGRGTRDVAAMRADDDAPTPERDTMIERESERSCGWNSSLSLLPPA